MNVAKRVLTHIYRKWVESPEDACRRYLAERETERFMRECTVPLTLRPDAVILRSLVVDKDAGIYYTQANRVCHTWRSPFTGATETVCFPIANAGAITETFAVAPVELEARELGRWLEGGR